MLAGKETVANLWIVSMLEIQSDCPSGPEDLDFILCPICRCLAAWRGGLDAELEGSGPGKLTPQILGGLGRTEGLM